MLPTDLHDVLPAEADCVIAIEHAAHLAGVPVPKFPCDEPTALNFLAEVMQLDTSPQTIAALERARQWSSPEEFAARDLLHLGSILDALRCWRFVPDQCVHPMTEAGRAFHEAVESKTVHEITDRLLESGLDLRRILAMFVLAESKASREVLYWACRAFLHGRVSL